MENENIENEQEPTLEDVEEDLYVKRLKEDNQRVLGEILEALNQEEVKFIPKLSESRFKEDFLPVLAAYKYMESGDDKHMIHKWLELADGWYGEVDITDDETGEVLYTVPSLLQKNVINTNVMENVNMSEIVQRAKQESSRIYAQGANYLTDRLSNLPEGYISDQTTEYEDRWKAIFDRYKNPENKDDKQKNKEPVKEDYGINYDD